MRRVTSKSNIARDFVFRSKYIFGGPPSTVGAMQGNILATVWALCGEEGGGGKYVGRSGDE